MTESIKVKVDLSGDSPESDCLDCLVGLFPAINQMRADSDCKIIPEAMVAHTLDAFSKTEKDDKGLFFVASVAQDLLYKQVAELRILDKYTESYIIQVIKYFFLQLSEHELKTFYILDNSLRDDRYKLILKIFGDAGISVVTPRQDGKDWSTLQARIRTCLEMVGHVAYIEPDAEVNYIEEAKQLARTSGSIATFRNLAPSDSEIEVLSTSSAAGQAAKPDVPT